MEGEYFVGPRPRHDDGMAMRIAEAVCRMEEIIGDDAGGRGIAGLKCEGELMASASQLVDSSAGEGKGESHPSIMTRSSTLFGAHFVHPSTIVPPLTIIIIAIISSSSSSSSSSS